jgi:hypothetical protein
VIACRYQGYPALRAGVLLCEQQCKDGVLDYRFEETLASSTDGPMVRGIKGVLCSIKAIFLSPMFFFDIDCVLVS